ncbi:hypothetical protein BKH29_01360 [Actinomyces oris]|uniref:Uncharacterized protein n=1 Tax=Actinomyces oris TaxID=544580 RepID=A0A1Q8VEG1_9ACTO|nr:hypothetical protein BKH29_01360 [Actinomyces oris]
MIVDIDGKVKEPSGADGIEHGSRILGIVLLRLYALDQFIPVLRLYTFLGGIHKISGIFFGGTPIVYGIVFLDIFDRLRMSVCDNIGDGPVRLLGCYTAIVSRFCCVQARLEIGNSILEILAMATCIKFKTT